MEGSSRRFSQFARPAPCWTYTCIVLGLALHPARSFGQGGWFRGNTHVHTANSDGNSSPQAVVRWYQEHGYHFIVLTDHNYRTPVERLNADHGAPGKFLIVAGVEVTDRLSGRPVHLSGVGVQENVVPAGGTTVAEMISRNAQAIRTAGGVPVINHPNGVLRAALTADEVERSTGATLFEVCCADYRGGSGIASTEDLWDVVLSAGRTLYGVAADDAHRFGGEYREAGTAWIMVRATELTVPAILVALERGDFYATTGVNIQSLETTPEGLRLELNQAEAFGYRTFFIGREGRTLKQDESMKPSYDFRSGDAYVRIRIERSDGAFAWTQPVFRERR